MRVVKIVCDRCGAEIQGNPIRLVPEYGSRKNEDLTAEDGGMPEVAFAMADKDFCEKCINKIYHYASGDMKVSEDFEKAAKETVACSPPDEKAREECNSGESDYDTGEQQKPSRTKVDIGKVIALKRAGWSVKRIAEEFNVSEQAVYKVISKLKEEGKI